MAGTFSLSEPTIDPLFARPGLKPPTKQYMAACITIGPLLVLSPLLGPVSTTDKKPKLCVSV